MDFLYLVQRLPLYLSLSQFLIDWFEQHLSEYMDMEEDGCLPDDETLWGAFVHRAGNLLEICHPNTVDSWFLEVTIFWGKRRSGSYQYENSDKIT
jgi:hypothetical protein